MLARFADDPDMEKGMIDSTITRAQFRAAGTQKKWRPGSPGVGT